MRVTHGCIRMYPEDIERLYPLVNVGTPVHLVNQPVKLGWSAGTLYMEVHQPLDEDRMSYEQLLNLAMDLLEKKTKGKEITIDGAAMRQALQKPTGIPVAISKPSEPLPETIQSLGDVALRHFRSATEKKFLALFREKFSRFRLKRREPVFVDEHGLEFEPILPCLSGNMFENPLPFRAGEGRFLQSFGFNA